MTRDIAPLAEKIEALFRAERVLTPQPTELRERILQRARAVVDDSPLEDANLGRRRYLMFIAAAALIALTISAGAFEAVKRWPMARAFASRGMVTAVREPARGGRESAPAEGQGASTEEVPGPSTSERAASTPEPSRTARDRDAQAELRLLERARQDLARGEFSSALATLGAHERRFPSGRLAEEREALKVTALLGLDRREEARHTALEFRRRFPHSVLLSKMDDILSAP